MAEPGDEQQQVPETVVSTSPDPVGDSSDELPDFADALRAARDQGSEPEPQADQGEVEDEDDESDAEAEEPSPEGETPAAPDQQQPDRRPTQRQRLQQRVDLLSRERDQKQAELEALQSRVSQSQQAVLQELGQSQEYARLVQKRLDPNESLTYAEEETYQRLHGAFTTAATYRDLAWNGTNARIQQTAQAEGIDIAMPPHGMDSAAFTKQLIQAVRAQAREESKDEIERLTADRDSLLTKRAARSPDPGVAGRSGGSSSMGQPSWDEDDPTAFFKAGAEQRARNGRP